jgi:hypothetical protein
VRPDERAERDLRLAVAVDVVGADRAANSAEEAAFHERAERHGPLQASWSAEQHVRLEHREAARLLDEHGQVLGASTPEVGAGGLLDGRTGRQEGRDRVEVGRLVQVGRHQPPLLADLLSSPGAGDGVARRQGRGSRAGFVGFT